MVELGAWMDCRRFQDRGHIRVIGWIDRIARTTTHRWDDWEARPDLHGPVERTTKAYLYDFVDRIFLAQLDSAAQPQWNVLLRSGMQLDHRWVGARRDGRADLRQHLQVHLQRRRRPHPEDQPDQFRRCGQLRLLCAKLSRADGFTARYRQTPPSRPAATRRSAMINRETGQTAGACTIRWMS